MNTKKIFVTFAAIVGFGLLFKDGCAAYVANATPIAAESQEIAGYYKTSSALYPEKEFVQVMICDEGGWTPKKECDDQMKHMQTVKVEVVTPVQAALKPVLCVENEMGNPKVLIALRQPIHFYNGTNCTMADASSY